MRVFSKIILVVGIVAVIVAIVIGFQPSWEVNSYYATLPANPNAPFANPVVQLIWAIVVLAVGMFLVGVGVGMHRRKKPADDKPLPKPKPNPGQSPDPTPGA